jgi:transposase
MPAANAWSSARALASTVLRLLRHGPLSPPLPIKVVGVDEWAWRKGQRYGTLLVDLERHMPIDLLVDATAESFAAWLTAHPSVEFISRDRGATFADGATRGAPQAVQIADRWHVIHNLGEALEKVLARHHTDLKRASTPKHELSAQGLCCKKTWCNTKGVQPSLVVGLRLPLETGWR